MLSDTKGDTSNKRAPTLDLQDMLIVAIMLERRALGPDDAKISTRSPHTNSVFMFKSTTSKIEDPPDYVDLNLEGAVDSFGLDLPDIDIIESIVASLVEQDLLHGFISQRIYGSRLSAPKPEED